MPKHRGNKNIKPKSVLHIFCEGSKTEPAYINGYLGMNHPGNRTLKVIRIEKTRTNTPKQLIEEAIELKNRAEFLKDDEIWVVFDRESVNKYSDELHLVSRARADKHDIKIALSNVCFEMWILLHFIECDAPYTCFENLEKESPLKEKLKEVGIERYNKADLALFDKIKSKIPDARRRAQQLSIKIKEVNPGKNFPHQLNPYTDMYLLLDAIDNFVKKFEHP